MYAPVLTDTTSIAAVHSLWKVTALLVKYGRP